MLDSNQYAANQVCIGCIATQCATVVQAVSITFSHLRSLSSLVPVATCGMCLLHRIYRIRYCTQVMFQQMLAKAAQQSANKRDIPADTLYGMLRAAQYNVTRSEVDRIAATCPGQAEGSVDHLHFQAWLDTAPARVLGEPKPRSEDTLTTATPWQVRGGAASVNTSMPDHVNLRHI